MSQLRKVKIKIPLDYVEKIAEVLSCKVERNFYLSGYSTRGTFVPIAIIDSARRELGFTGEGELIYDDMDASLARNVVDKYFEMRLRERNFHYERKMDDKKVVYTIKRG